MQPVSIIIPVFNESESLKEVLQTIYELMINEKHPFEIIVIDDGSSDESCKNINMDKVKIIRHSHNRGYGASLKTGIRSSNFPNILIIDADGTYPHTDILTLMNEFENDSNLSMVIGARIGNNVKIPAIRKPAKWFINKLANYLTDTKIPDLNSGLRLMKKDIVNKFLNILPDGFSFTSTITIAMLCNNYEIKFVAIDYKTRKGISKIQPIKDTLNFIQLVIRTTLYFNPLKIFIPLSFLFILLAFIIGIGSFILLSKPLDVTTSIVLMTGILILAIGMLADLIDKRIS